MGVNVIIDISPDPQFPTLVGVRQRYWLEDAKTILGLISIGIVIGVVLAYIVLGCWSPGETKPAESGGVRSDSSELRLNAKSAETKRYLQTYRPKSGVDCKRLSDVTA